MEKEERMRGQKSLFPLNDIDKERKTNNNFIIIIISSVLLLFLLSTPILVEALATPQSSSTGRIKATGGRSFVFSPADIEKPKLILISGCTGTGKSTFGMSVALDQGILKCISTDTIRAVMRSFVSKDISPALHRSSYAYSSVEQNDDPIISWKETCRVLSASIEELVDDAIRRRVSLVVEGVHVMPSTSLITKWENAGGIATGCLLRIQDIESHKNLLRKRGYVTGNIDVEEEKLQSFDRIRIIQEEMISMASDANWIFIDQRLDEMTPLEMIQNQLVLSSYNNNSSSNSNITTFDNI